MVAPQADLHNLSVQIGRLLASDESAKSQRANTYERLERVEQKLERVATILENLPHQLEQLGERLSSHVKDDDARLTKLEHAETTRKTRERLLWGGMTFLGAANIWALFKGAILTVVKGG